MKQYTRVDNIIPGIAENAGIDRELVNYISGLCLKTSGSGERRTHSVTGRHEKRSVNHNISLRPPLKETIIVICCLVNMVMAGIDCPLGSCLEQSLFPIFLHVWSELDEHVWLVLQGFSSRLTLFPAFSAVVVTLRVTRDAIVQETHETVVMRFLMFTSCDLYFHSILGLSVSYFIGLFVALLYSPFMERKLF
ncbi:hypothetical protein F2Q70_00007081 [Brassica cretica]|uniref:Uncharacterized protein n=1 Tax=Brassica cretica TaxID=69181 RepID=A0A8S9LVI8_BRACR|nr:hypothetical protein F2Q70_00007081 [Brassica cretica]